MDDFLSALPKAELHLHLEGSIEPETLHELDPATGVEEFRTLYRYDNFDAFLKAFGAIGKRLRTPEDYALITRRLLERLKAQNVQYAEIIIAAGVVLWKGQEFGPIFDAVRAAARESTVEVQWILDAVRQFGAEHVRTVAELAAKIKEVREAAARINGGAAPLTIQVHTPQAGFMQRPGSAEEHRDHLGQLADAGVDSFVLRPPGDSVCDAVEALHQYAETFLR